MTRVNYMLSVNAKSLWSILKPNNRISKKDVSQKAQLVNSENVEHSTVDLGFTKTVKNLVVNIKMLHTRTWITIL